MAESRKTLEFDLYFDETGKFDESARGRKSQKYPSQFAGFVVPRGDIESEAQKIVEACKKPARIRPEESFKGNELSDRRLEPFVRRLIEEFRQRPHWDPVRMVNQERVNYGNRVATYTNVFAELILRILQRKSTEEPDARISIKPYGTTWMRDGYHHLRRDEYETRVEETVKLLAVRRGLAVESIRWAPEEPVLNFGRERAELLIADILSHASHDDFRRLDFKEPRRRSNTSKQLIALFGDRNWTLTVRELIERVSLLVEECSFGMALILIAETLRGEASLEEYDPTFVENAKVSVRDIIHHLGGMGSRGRDPQLASVLNWLDQIIGHQRLLNRGYLLAQWLLMNVAQPLRGAIKDSKERETLDWFQYGLHRWALTAANHEGKLLEAQNEAQCMSEIAPRLARQWERAPVLFDGLIAQAVHLTDAFEFARISKDLRLVADSLETQSGLFSTYLSDQFPEPIKFDVRTKAIGTLVQSEMLQGLSDADHLNKTRSLSDAAINDFVDPKDKSRQYQYRCHLETLAGDFASARKYLIWSMRKAQTEELDFSHMSIQRLLCADDNDTRWVKDFTASHWLRLGAMTCLKEDPEGEHFLTAFDESGLLKSYIEQPTLTDFPIHNILRFLAVIEASRGRFDSAFAALSRLHELNPIGNSQFILAMVLLAGQAEIAGLLWSSNREEAASLLDNSSDQRVGLKQLFFRMREGNVREFPRMAELLDSWEDRIDSLIMADIPPSTAKDVLLGIGSEVRY